VRVYALSIHADYKCRHSGACCTADWDVPVELPIYRRLTEAVERGALEPASTADNAPFITGPDLPEGAAAILNRADNGDCVFFHRGSRLCVVHRDLGEPALPATCRHFPRVAVRDPRGTFITLSHFCPTAASMLFRDDVPLEIVEDPIAFPDADYDGLRVAPDAWPPLLHPRMLMDHSGYSAWERHMVARCAEPGQTAESVLATLARDAEILRTWRPGSATLESGVSLESAVAALPSARVAAEPHALLDRSLALMADVIAAVPDDLKPTPDDRELPRAYEAFVRPDWNVWAEPLTRYLAAKAFANWTAYQGRGVRSIVCGLAACVAIVRVEAARQCRNARRALDADLLRDAIRSADFLLNHLAVGDDLARIWSRAEAS
jgi:Fe-S-cluster containining protein